MRSVWKFNRISNPTRNKSQGQEKVSKIHAKFKTAVMALQLRYYTYATTSPNNENKLPIQGT
jgi:hypothetical protein